MRRLLSLLASLGLAAGSASAAAQTAAVAPGKAPAAWVAYADLASKALPDWLDGESPAAIRLRAFLDAGRAERGDEPYLLSLSLWVAADGAVSRLEAPGLADAQAVDDLRTAIVGRRLPQAPPADLRYPMRLRLRITSPPPAPAAPPTDAASP